MNESLDYNTEKTLKELYALEETHKELLEEVKHLRSLKELYTKNPTLSDFAEELVTLRAQVEELNKHKVVETKKTCGDCAEGSKGKSITSCDSDEDTGREDKTFNTDPACPVWRATLEGKIIQRLQSELTLYKKGLEKSREILNNTLMGRTSAEAEKAEYIHKLKMEAMKTNDPKIIEELRELGELIPTYLHENPKEP